MIAPKGPVFANEIFLMILEYFFASLSTFKAGKMTDVKFKALLAAGVLFRFGRVSKTFASLAFQAFYQIHEFKLYQRHVAHLGENLRSIALPPSLYYQCLRRIQVVVVLTDHRVTYLPGADPSLPLYQRLAKTAVISANELFALCPDARALLEISKMTGLKALDLDIIPNFVNKKGAIALYKSSGIALRADEVKLTVGQRRLKWHARLGKALGL
jgi:hypothetical protein